MHAAAVDDGGAFGLVDQSDRGLDIGIGRGGAHEGDLFRAVVDEDRQGVLVPVGVENVMRDDQGDGAGAG
jgi:hypothetical protein